MGHWRMCPPWTSNCLIFQVTSPEPYKLRHSTPCSFLSIINRYRGWNISSAVSEWHNYVIFLSPLNYFFLVSSCPPRVESWRRHWSREMIHERLHRQWLLLVLISPTHGRMTRLSWPGWLSHQDGHTRERSPISVLTRLAIYLYFMARNIILLGVEYINLTRACILTRLRWEGFLVFANWPG